MKPEPALLNPATLNATHLRQELGWLRDCLKQAQASYPGDESELPEAPDFAVGDSGYSSLIARHAFNSEERLILILALAPLLEPSLLDLLHAPHPYGTWGCTGAKNRYVHPTRETALLVIAGSDLYKRLRILHYFESQHIFQRENLLGQGQRNMESTPNHEALLPGRELLEVVRYGEIQKPEFNHEFPARLIETGMHWNDLILAESTRRDLEEIKVWMQHGEILHQKWNQGHKFKKGYRSLFFGPSGTGKTLTACLLGKNSGRDVYRIDLSQVVSKYIGETEKNLNKLFDRAEHRNWILFFDEADALFGKRTAVSDAHDRYANQEVSFLLQRIEDYNGMVILTSNFKSNMDEAFTRRFQSMVYFPLPKASERLQLWQNNLPEGMKLEENLKLSELANRWELSGGSINSICLYASLMAINKGQETITQADVMEGIRRELDKQGRIM